MPVSTRPTQATAQATNPPRRIDSQFAPECLKTNCPFHHATRTDERRRSNRRPPDNGSADSQISVNNGDLPPVPTRPHNSVVVPRALPKRPLRPITPPGSSESGLRRVEMWSFGNRKDVMPLEYGEKGGVGKGPFPVNYTWLSPRNSRVSSRFVPPGHSFRVMSPVRAKQDALSGRVPSGSSDCDDCAAMSSRHGRPVQSPRANSKTRVGQANRK